MTEGIDPTLLAQITIVPVDGYTMIQRGMWNRLIETYGVQAVIIFIVTWFLLHCWYQFCIQFWKNHKEGMKDKKVVYDNGTVEDRDS